MIRDRVRWARRRGHPDYLWPDVSIVRWRNALRGVEEAVRAVLTTAGVVRHASFGPDGTAGDPEALRALGIAAFTSGLGPLLGRWIEDGRVAAAADVAEVLAEHLDHGRRRAARMAGLLADAVGALDAAGVQPVVVKGLQTGSAYFPEPGARPCADIDLAVRTREAGDAAAALRRAGWHAAGPEGGERSEWRRGGDDGVRSLELTHADNPVTLDLHAGLDRTFFGVRRISFGDDVFDRATPWPAVPGACTLPQPHLFAYLALHASEEFHRLQLVRLVELVLVARADLRDEGDWADVRDLVRRMAAGRFVYPALRLADRLAPGAIDGAWLEELEAEAPGRMRRSLSGLRPADAQRLEGLSLSDRFLWARGPVEVARRAAYLVRPAGRGIPSLYAERVWRVLRGRVSLGPPGRPGE